MEIAAPLVLFVLALLPLLSLFCFISAIFNQWAYRNVIAIKDPRRRRTVLIVTGIALLITQIVIILILAMFLRPQDQI